MRSKSNIVLSLVLLIVFSLTSLPQSTKKDIQTLLEQYTTNTQGGAQVLPARTELVVVKRVVDGDTIVVTIEGKDEKVRLIGINSPETVDPRKPVECFGKEAKEYLKSLLVKRLVNLEPDPTQQDRDKYGRLLRYVFLPDGTLVNQLMITKGFAYEYTYDLPYKYQKDFKSGQQRAEALGRGLWDDRTCAGKK